MKALLIISLLPFLAQTSQAAAPAPGEKLWEFQTGGGASSPAIGFDGTVYVGSDDGKVYAINGATGDKVWEFQTGGMVDSSPCVGPDGTIFIGSSDAQVYALDGATGHKLWSFATVPWVSSSPALAANGTLYAGAGRPADNDNIYALSAASAQQLWMFQAGFGEGARSSPALDVDGTVFVGAVGKVFAFDGPTGEMRWQFAAGGFVESSPAIGANRTVYVGSLDGKIYCLNTATGQKIWEFPTAFLGPVSSSPVIGPDGTVYVGSFEGRLYALSGLTGQAIWDFPMAPSVFSTAALAADGTLYIGSSDGKVYALNASSGQEVWEFQTGGPVNSSPAIGADGTVYIGSSDGKLYALHGTSPLAQGPWPKFRRDAQNTGQATRAPRIEKQPSLAVLKEGKEGRIQVLVSGLPVPQMQWFCNTNLIPEGTNSILSLPSVTRLVEGSYWLAASNALGQATSAPIVALVSNVDPSRFVTLHWTGQPDSSLTLQSTYRLGRSAAWTVLSNYPPSAADQYYVELFAGGAGFYRLAGNRSAPAFATTGTVNGWKILDAPGTPQRIEFASASTGWTNWVLSTNLVLPSSPYLFLDEASFGDPQRVYRITVGP
jgi:outer membrane protein assembly factor BamB